MRPLLRVFSTWGEGPLEGVTFTRNGVERVTPSTEGLAAGVYTVVMPGEPKLDLGNFRFQQWENGSTNPTRAINLTEDMDISAHFFKPPVAPPPPPPTGATDPYWREKYQRKTHFVKLTWQLRRIEDRTRRNRAVAQAQLAFFQDKVRALMDKLGVYADLRHQYMAYAQALDKSQREMDWLVDVNREARILRDRFTRRGLDPDVLQAIYELVTYRTANR